MVKRVLFAGVAAMLSFAAQAEQEHAVTSEADLVPVVQREVCTTMLWGFDEVRTDCRAQVLPAPKGNPALKGICTIYYGRRTCH